jgi:hypothetical protein
MQCYNTVTEFGMSCDLYNEIYGHQIEALVIFKRTICNVLGLSWTN